MADYNVDTLQIEIEANSTKAANALDGLVSALKGLKAEDAVKDISNMPLHPGAAKYYKEIGVLK